MLICLNLANLLSAKSEQVTQGWVLRQSSSFANLVFSDLTDNALKMRIGKPSLIIIIKGPKWNALIFNESLKRYADLPYNDWHKLFITNKNNYSNTDGKPVLTIQHTNKVTNICNFKAHESIVLKRKKSGKSTTEEKMFRLWMVSEVKAPRQISQIFCSLLAIPIQAGIPLKAYRFINGKEVSALDTLAIERHAIPASTFKPLSGYKKVKDQFEVIMGESASQDINDLLDVPTK